MGPLCVARIWVITDTPSACMKDAVLDPRTQAIAAQERVVQSDGQLRENATSALGQNGGAACLLKRQEEEDGTQDTIRELVDAVAAASATRRRGRRLHPNPNITPGRGSSMILEGSGADSMVICLSIL